LRDGYLILTWEEKEIGFTNFICKIPAMTFFFIFLHYTFQVWLVISNTFLKPKILFSFALSFLLSSYLLTSYIGLEILGVEVYLLEHSLYQKLGN
jgi:hypothetical protein